MMEYRPIKFLYFLASIGLVLVAAVITSLVNLAPGPAVDIRARAGTQNLMTFTATVSSVETVEGVVTVDNLTMVGKEETDTGKNLGTWKLLTPTRFNVASVQTGTTLTIRVPGTGLDIANRTINATEIVVSR